jgi:hypothetical protein
VPASLLLSLLDDPSGEGGGDAPTATAAAGGGGGGGGQPEAVSSLVKDSVLASLVRLDDASQVGGVSREGTGLLLGAAVLVHVAQHASPPF